MRVCWRQYGGISVGAQQNTKSLSPRGQRHSCPKSASSNVFGPSSANDLIAASGEGGNGGDGIAVGALCFTVQFGLGLGFATVAFTVEVSRLVHEFGPFHPLRCIFPMMALREKPSTIPISLALFPSAHILRHVSIRSSVHAIAYPSLFLRYVTSAITPSASHIRGPGSRRPFSTSLTYEGEK